MYLCLFNEISLKEHLKWHKTIWNSIFTDYHRLMKSLKLSKWFIIRLWVVHISVKSLPHLRSFIWLFYLSKVTAWIVHSRFCKFLALLDSAFCILQEERILGTGSTVTAQTDSTSQSVQMPLNHTLRVNMIHLSVWALRPDHFPHTSGTLQSSLSLSFSPAPYRRRVLKRDYETISYWKGIV